MRAWPLALLALLILPLGAAQQPGEFDFDEDYLARVAKGDIATSSFEEPAGTWSIAEYVNVDYDGNETRVAVASSQGEVLEVGCTCNQSSHEGSDIVLPAGQEPGTYTVHLIRSIGEGSAAAFDLALFTGQTDARIVAYVPQDHSVQTNADFLRSVGSCTSAPCTIEEYAPSGGTWFAITPGGTTAPQVPADEGGVDIFSVAIGFLAGLLVWAFLVQRGLVQKRRRQQVQQAAHVSAAAEGKEGLTARKRILMAGLKELEMAKMNKDIDSAVYDKLKAELKKETVTVMRALEAAE